MSVRTFSTPLNGSCAALPIAADKLPPGWEAKPAPNLANCKNKFLLVASSSTFKADSIAGKYSFKDFSKSDVPSSPNPSSFSGGGGGVLGSFSSLNFSIASSIFFSLEKILVSKAPIGVPSCLASSLRF